MADKQKNSILSYLKGFSSKRVYVYGPLAKKQEVKEPCFFIDGGVSLRQKREGFSLGDGDSSKKEKMDVLFSEKKDFSDLSYLLDHLPPVYEEYFFSGFLGGRKDHEWTNLMCLSHFVKKHSSQTKLYLDQEAFFMNQGEARFRHSGVFSVWSMDEAELSIQGDVEYPYNGKLKSYSSHGISNLASGEVYIQSSGMILIYLGK